MIDLAIIDNPAAAAISLDPIRSRLLAELAQPGTASTLATKVGLPRQKVNYHLHELERHGLIELVEERRKGSMIERVMRATAASYVISPAALAAVEPDPDRTPDRLSALWLLAVAARQVKELGELIGRAKRARQALATFGIDANVRFATAADRAAFAKELSESTETLIAKYHDESAPGGREHRLLVALHPKITRPETETARPDPVQQGHNQEETDNA